MITAIVGLGLILGVFVLAARQTTRRLDMIDHPIWNMMFEDGLREGLDPVQAACLANTAYRHIVEG